MTSRLSQWARRRASGVRKRSCLSIVALVLIFCTAAFAQEMKVQEQITVQRVIVDLRAVDYKGNPLPNLKPENFRVLVDSLPAELESIEWIDSTKPYAEGLAPHEADEAGAPQVPEGRLIVIFFQTDFQRAKSRVGGQMKMTLYALQFLDTLTPQDRVAVVSFDSHLKLRQDFTTERSKLERAIRSAVLIDDPPPMQLVPSPSLGSRIKPEEAKEASTPEKAMFLIGNALLNIPGPKTMILFGWGLGRLTPSGVQMVRDYSLAKIALEASRTSVFSLDVSEADYHSLEAGLGKVSDDTGGFYAKTNLFPQMAMNKLERVISGHYTLVVKKPAALPSGLHKIEVQLRGVKGEVMTRSTFRD